MPITSPAAPAMPKRFGVVATPATPFTCTSAPAPLSAHMTSAAAFL
ncbi:Uncharacterised protein [Mycobacterium tuberculosis]|nr:Uncharacterised protein [Mycobacterium tuberculosis]